MGNSIRQIICAEGSPRLDKYLTAALPELSRARIQTLIGEGMIMVDGKAAKASQEVKAGQSISVMLPEMKPVSVEASDIPLEVLFEDSDIIVINKPQGMVVHPACGHYDDTLVNALLNHCHDLSGVNGELRPGIVHRIDKDTSGVLVAAKNDRAHNGLTQQWKGHNIKRVYIALLCGVMQENAGTVEAAIGRSRQNRLKMTVDAENGREAITHYRVLERFERYTLVECRLETGRTHQIRVHMAYLGHPVAGDPLYGRKKDALGHNGQFLHAGVLGFKHPVTGEYMEFFSELPAAFQAKLAQLRKGEI